MRRWLLYDKTTDYIDSILESSEKPMVDGLSCFLLPQGFVVSSKDQLASHILRRAKDKNHPDSSRYITPQIVWGRA